MVRILVFKSLNDGVNYIEAAGLSTDDKPTAGIATGSKFTEANTGDTYMFAEGDSPTWTKIAAGYVDPEG